MSFVVSCLLQRYGKILGKHRLFTSITRVADTVSFYHSSWNSEISQIYPQFSLEAINKLEMVFCKELGWNLYISSSQYAKYYFALRSLTEKRDFRRNYNFMMMVNAPGAKQVEERSEEIKQIALNNMTLSRSL